MRKALNHARQGDIPTHLVIFFLGISMIIALLGMIFGPTQNAATLMTVVVGGQTALAAILARPTATAQRATDTPAGTPSDPISTKVENTADDSVPVTPGEPTN